MFERFDVEFPVKFLNQNTNKEGAGKIINISADGGCMILTVEDLPFATPLELQLFIPDNKDPLKANGRVVWSKMLKDNVFMVGVQFQEVGFMGIARALRAYK